MRLNFKANVSSSLYGHDFWTRTINILCLELLQKFYNPFCKTVQEHNHVLLDWKAKNYDRRNYLNHFTNYMKTC